MRHNYKRRAFQVCAKEDDGGYVDDLGDGWAEGNGLLGAAVCGCGNISVPGTDRRRSKHLITIARGRREASRKGRQKRCTVLKRS
jgi:hypothetical protein